MSFISFFLAGFVCFLIALTIYLRREDTQWHRTVGMLKDMTAQMSDNKFSLDNTLQTILKIIDDARLEATKQTMDVRLAHDVEIEKIRAQMVEMSSHLAHLRKEHHKIQIMLTQTSTAAQKCAAPPQVRSLPVMQKKKKLKVKRSRHVQ